MHDAEPIETLSPSLQFYKRIHPSQLTFGDALGIHARFKGYNLANIIYGPTDATSHFAIKHHYPTEAFVVHALQGLGFLAKDRTTFDQPAVVSALETYFIKAEHYQSLQTSFVDKLRCALFLKPMTVLDFTKELMRVGWHSRRTLEKNEREVLAILNHSSKTALPDEALMEAAFKIFHIPAGHSFDERAGYFSAINIERSGDFCTDLEHIIKLRGLSYEELAGRMMAKGWHSDGELASNATLVHNILRRHKHREMPDSVFLNAIFSALGINEKTPASQMEHFNALFVEKTGERPDGWLSARVIAARLGFPEENYAAVRAAEEMMKVLHDPLIAVHKWVPYEGGKPGIPLYLNFCHPDLLDKEVFTRAKVEEAIAKQQAPFVDGARAAR